MTILTTLAILILFVVPWFEDTGFWLSEYHLIILIAGAYILYNIFNYIKSPHYISYSDQGEMIIFRYYSLNLFNSKKHSIEIPKKQFVKYELNPFFFGLYKKIVLYQHFRNRMAAYPPISLSALGKEDLDKILASLQKYVKH